MIPTRWCIVVADAAGPEWPLSEDVDAPLAPVQFCGLGGPTTMLQKALHRAVRIAKAARVMVTADERNRSHWQPALWFMRAGQRFVSESPGWSLLSTAAAVLSIGAQTPSALITILPARSYVVDEWTLTVALNRVLSDRSFLADGIVTLGMVSAQPGVDEDYLVLSAPDGRPTVAVSVTAQGPAEWFARDLVRRGAVVASGIYVAYARAMVAGGTPRGVAPLLGSAAMDARSCPAGCALWLEQPWITPRDRTNRNRAAVPEDVALDLATP
jgi:mannose-1-phosphate guanylyltransferase